MKLSEEKFDIKKFLNPPIKYSPVYSWVWNGHVTRQKTDEQLLEMQRLGIKRFYIIPEPKQFRPTKMPTELEPDYLTEPYFNEIKYTVCRANELGMECWLYDEGGWPSGGACGKVLKKHPEYARRVPEVIKTYYNVGEIYKKSSECVLAAFTDSDLMLEDGYKFTERTLVKEYASKPIFFEEIGLPDFPDLSLSEATDCFIDLTHEGYYSVLEERLGESVAVLFTDEPTLPKPFPLNKTTIEAYENEYGESVLPYLPAICSNEKKDEKSVQVRINWYDICSRLLCENYLDRCKKWANAHGMKFTGHMDKDHYLRGAIEGGNMHLLRSLRHFDVPGIDVIWRQIFRGKTGTHTPFGESVPVNGFFPRYASSAAAQIGSDVALTESMGVYGCGTTYDQMRFVYGYQAIRGINVFNPMLLLYDRSANMMAGELPIYREDQACCADLSEWNLYLERLSYVTSFGKRVCDTALYYPIRDIWADVDAQAVSESYEGLGRLLEDKHIDFDIVDDDIIENATGLEGGMICCGDACYRRIVMPLCRYLSPKAEKNLEIFKANGGFVCESADEINSPDVVVDAPTGLQMMQRRTVDAEIYCFFNSGESSAEFTFDFKNNIGYCINITDGTTQVLEYNNGFVSIELQSGEIGVVCITDNLPGLSEKKKTKSSIAIDNFKFKRINSFEIGEMYATTRTFEEESVEIELGDWKERTGEEFSGVALYESEFEMPDDVFGNIVLDLGDVRYTADVYFNGVSLGKKIMPPYRYEIARDILLERNHIEIVVKNTAGNQFYYTKSFDKWPDWMIAPYYAIAKEFDKETLSSGLFGPVKILY